MAETTHADAHGWLRRALSVVRLNRGPIAVGAVFALAAVNFNAYRVFGDGLVPYRFVQRLFGADSHPVAYQFGLGLLEAPFYGLGLMLHDAGVTIEGNQPAPAMISLAANAFVLGTAAIVTWLLLQMRFRRRGLVVAAAIFGTPLWYYGIFSPAYTHAGDTLLLTAAAALVYVYWRDDAVWAAGAAGALVGFAITLRYANVAEAAGLAAALLALRRPRAAVVSAAAAATAFGLLFLVPVSLGVPFFRKGLTPASLSFTPQAPLAMLFTDHRGLFVWTPVTALGTLGYARLLHRRADVRPFLVVIGVMGLALVAIYAAWHDWDAGWSFSQRYFTALLPIVALGLAELVERRPRIVVPAAAVATLWSLYLGFNHVFGANQQDGAYGVAAKLWNGERSPHDFLRLLEAYSRLKYLL